jgi:ABC-type multidrug transport system fused ATPase/permease subunit
MHALGHAAVALVAGAVAVALAQKWGFADVDARRPGGLGAPADRALLLSLVGLAVIYVKGVAGVYATYVQTRTAAEVGAELRLEVLHVLLGRHPLRRPRHADHGPVPSTTPTASALGTLTERVREVETGLGQGFLGGARAIAQLVPLAALLVVLSSRMAAVAAVALGAFGLVLSRVRADYARATSAALAERDKLLEVADESVRHADLWVTYGAEAKARRAMQLLGATMARASARLAARAAGLSAANEVLGAGALVLAVATSRAGWLGKVADGTTLLAFAVAFFLAYRPMRELADARLAMRRAQVAYDEVCRIIGETPTVAETGPDGGDAEGATHTSWRLGRLEVSGLRLDHAFCAPVSFRVEPGAIAVIVGATGVGKTTLLRTLLGLESALEGDVSFDGIALANAPAGPLGRPFAWVPQDAPLLADTLAANVELGASRKSLASLEQVGGMRLEASLRDARLGAGGRAVSGGERQWIALARAIATEQPVLLLDEPTNGLDADAERRVLRTIEELRGRRTVLLVTHRKEPLSIADVVVRLERRPVEEAAA